MRFFKELQTLKSTFCSIGMQNYHFAPSNKRQDFPKYPCKHTVIRSFAFYNFCPKYMYKTFFLSLVLGRTIVSSVLWVFYTTFPGNYLHGLYHYCFVIAYSDGVCWCYKSMLQIMGTLRLPLHSTKSLPSIPMLNKFCTSL